MPIYRVIEPRLGRLQVKEWRRRALRTLGLLLLALVGCTVGLFLLDSSVTGQNSQRGALLQRAGASEVVIADDLIAEALIGRLGEHPRA